MPALPSPSGRPSAFQRQHLAGFEVPRVDDLVFRPAWRVRLDGLAIATVLTPREFRVAAEYRAAAERAAAGDVHAIKLHVVGRVANHYRGGLERSERQLDLLRLLAAVRQRLGGAAVTLSRR